MQIGFAKIDITPRVGVELCGFGPYLNRHSIAVRDRLWARGVAMRVGDTTLILISCDVIGIPAAITQKVRRLIQARLDLPDAAIMLHATHTHSGPSTGQLIGWGDPDEPYHELLPTRIAAAGLAAAANLADATLHHAVAPCEGIALNREYDRDAPPLAEVLAPNWRPAKPELTDTKCHVFAAKSADRVIGFLSYFGCHPVVCSETTRYIHGDFVGVATNLLEREYPGSVGLFLQGAMGDVNSCVVHKPEAEAMLALDIIAGRYANAVRDGLNRVTPLPVDQLQCVSQQATFAPAPLTVADIRARLADQEAIIGTPGLNDTDFNLRIATVRATAYRRVLRRIEAGMTAPAPVEFNAFRLGPITLLGTPFEVFQAIKNDILAKAISPQPLVLSMANDCIGYAVDRTIAAKGGYAAQMVPLMLGTLPLGDIHDPLVNTVLQLERAACGRA